MCVVAYLRHVAVAGGLEPQQALITHVSNKLLEMVKHEVHEYHTAVKRHNPSGDITSHPPEIHRVPDAEEDKLHHLRGNAKEIDDLSPGERNIHGKNIANTKNRASSKQYSPTYWDHRRWKGTFVQEMGQPLYRGLVREA